MKLESDQRIEFEESAIELDIPFPSTEGVTTPDQAWKILSLTPPVVRRNLYSLVCDINNYCY